MIDTGTALIIGSFISLIGFLIFQERSVKNYFRKENFKIQKSNVMAQNKLNLKKLEREMGLTGKSVTPAEKPTGSGTVAGLIPLLKDLDPDTIKTLIDLLGVSNEGESEGGLMDILTNFAEENPELVKGFLDGIGKAKEGKDSFIGQT